jgi:hypothetical protein
VPTGENDLIIRSCDLIIRYKTIIFISLKSASTKALRIGNMLNNHMRRHRHYHTALTYDIGANYTRCPAHRIAELEKQ